MPRALDAKTKLELKASVVVFVAAIVIVAIAVFHKNAGFTTLQVDNQTFKLAVASSVDQQQLGLGYRKSLPKDQGMLFSFPSSQVECFWMKGMEFPLDIIWLNSSKQIVFIEKQVSPNTYPHSFCPQFPAQYVLELNSGEASYTNMRIGETLHF